jgi:CBS domain-containing protein
VCVVIAAVLGRRLLGATIYEFKLLRRGVDWQRVRRPRFLTRVRVATVQRAPSVLADPDEAIGTLAQRLGDTDELVIPVCSKTGFVGVVTSPDLARAVVAGVGDRSVSTIVRTFAERLDPNDTVERAATIMADGRIPLLPVVDARTDALVGIVTRRDVLQVYRSLTDV